LSGAVAGEGKFGARNPRSSVGISRGLKIPRVAVRSHSTKARRISMRAGRRLSQGVHRTTRACSSHPNRRRTCSPPVNPCKGGRANWKTAKKTRKIGNSAENNRAEQGKNSTSSWPGSTTRRRLPLLKLDTFLSAGNDAFFHDKKPGAVTRPGICITLNDVRLYRNHVTLSSKNYQQKLPTAKAIGRAKLERTKGAAPALALEAPYDAASLSLRATI
jgi:hypothetical protein